MVFGPRAFESVSLGENPFAVAIAADDVRTLVDHRIPEKRCGRFHPIFAGQFVLAHDADEFRNLRVGVQAGKFVLLFRGRIDERP